MRKILLSLAIITATVSGCAQKNQPDTTTTSLQKTPITVHIPSIQNALPKRINHIDTKKEIFYQCNQSKNDILRVMYGLIGQNVVVAQILYQSKLSPLLYRDTNNSSENVFVATSGISWSTKLSTSTQLDKTAGIALMQPGKSKQTYEIVAQNCLPIDPSSVNVNTTKTTVPQPAPTVAKTKKSLATATKSKTKTTSNNKNSRTTQSSKKTKSKQSQQSTKQRTKAKTQSKTTKSSTKPTAKKQPSVKKKTAT